MKLKIQLLSLMLGLSTFGSSCVNDDIRVVVNLNPIVGRFRITPGPDTLFGGSVTVKLDSLVSSEYKARIREGRVYDFRVKVEGEYSGSVTGNSTIKVGDGPTTELLRFPVTGSTLWSNFYSAQSLLSRSPYLVPGSAGIQQLLSALITNPLPEITLALRVSLSIAPVPYNLYVTVEVYLQADAEIN